MRSIFSCRARLYGKIYDEEKNGVIVNAVKLFQSRQCDVEAKLGLQLMRWSQCAP